MRGPKRRSLAERFEEKYIPEPMSGCWLWTGALSHGYGRIGEGGDRGRTLAAHRVAYELYRGPIPDDLGLDHLCRNPSCVNPWHLEPTTQKTNILRGIGPSATNARKTRCTRGHPYSLDNTTTDSRGKRICLTCRREHGIEDRRRRWRDYYYRHRDRLLRPERTGKYYREHREEVCRKSRERYHQKRAANK